MTTTVKHILDGIEIPSTNTDSRGPFYGHPCYLAGLVSLLSRNTVWEPVEIHVRDAEILINCRSCGSFSNRDLKYVASYFGLPEGWAVNGWNIGMEGPDEAPRGKRRMLTLGLWVDKALALAGSQGLVPDEVTEQIEHGRKTVSAQRRGRY